MAGVSHVLGLPIACVTPGGPKAVPGTGKAPATPRAPDATTDLNARTCRVAPPPRAFEHRLRIDAANCVDVDARLSEWPRLVETEVITEAGTGPALGVGLATDDAALYVAARLRGERAPSREEKIHLRLRFLMDMAGSTHPPPWDVWLNIPQGRHGAGAIVRRSSTGPTETIADARMAVVPSDAGFEVEAAIPWSALPPAATSRLGLRASVGYALAGSGSEFGVGYPDGELAPLPVEQLLLADLEADARRLWPGAPRSWLDAGADFPQAADLFGDARLERIGRIGGKISVCHADDARAQEPHGSCQQRDYGANARIEGIEARDIFGRGKQDLVVRYWKPTGKADHLVLEVSTFGSTQELRPVFRHEVSIYMQCCGSEANAPPHIRSEVRVERGAIEVRAEKAWRLTRSQFSEPPLGDGILPIVAPWDTPSVRRYVVINGKLVEASP